jgi:hypothetical protein
MKADTDPALEMNADSCGPGSRSGSRVNCFKGREIWLSPVIQATWEARAVGWFEVERPAQENRRAFGTALWLPASIIIILYYALGPTEAAKFFTFLLYTWKHRLLAN